MGWGSKSAINIQLNAIKSTTFTPMKITQQNSLTENQKAQLFKLWNSVYPIAFQYADLAAFEVFLNSISPIKHYMLELDNVFAGWCFIFDRNDERWFGIVVDPSFHKKGLGKTLIHTIQSDEDELNGWVITDKNLLKTNGEIYPSPLQFYLKIGFNQMPEITETYNGVNVVKINWQK